MSELALDELSGTIIGDYRLKYLFEYSKAGPIFLAHTITGVETYHLQFLIPPKTVEMHWYNDKLSHFNQLARQLIALRHPHILPILDYGIYRDIPYIVTPKLAIRSLRSRLSSTGAINVFTVGRYLDQITAALAYAHNHGV